MNNVDLGLQFNVTDAPDGEIDYYLTVGDGVAVLALGVLEDADASVGSDYDTAAAISKGELNVQMAFMTGKIKVGGNMAKVMMYQGLINEFARVSTTQERVRFGAMAFAAFVVSTLVIGWLTNPFPK